MAIVAGGIVTLKPIGGLISNNPAMSPQQVAQMAQDKATKHQEKLDTFINKVVDSQKGADNKPRWTVPFK